MVNQIIFFLNSANLICRTTDISKYFRESLGIRDNESRLYVLILCILTLCMHCCVLTCILLICDTEINQSIQKKNKKKKKKKKKKKLGNKVSLIVLWYILSYLAHCDIVENGFLLMYTLEGLTLILLFTTTPTFANSIDPDQMVSSVCHSVCEFE